jgi:predicted enzyme related to lactoylglutathione lyase
VDATIAQAQKLGATAHGPAMDIPQVGRYAVLQDPQGAVFSVFTAAGEMSAPPGETGQFSWAELNTTDYEAAWKFYSALFGWKERSQMDMGEGMGTYFMFQDPEEKTKGGISNMAKHMGVPAHWLYYVTVDDMDACIQRIKKAGGKILNGPMPIPGNDVIAQCQDPQGAFFAVYTHGKK